jgi:hypothetical protein
VLQGAEDSVNSLNAEPEVSKAPETAIEEDEADEAPIPERSPTPFDGLCVLLGGNPRTDKSSVDNLMPEWSPIALHSSLLSSIYDQDFTSPTAIQTAAIPVALNNKDVIGIAQTV